MDRSAAMADMRFDFIERVCEKTIIKPVESKERIRSEKIDNLLTGKWTAIPCFIAIMAMVFLLTFNVIGPFFQDILDEACSPGRRLGYNLAREPEPEPLSSGVRRFPTLRKKLCEGLPWWSGG